MRRPYPSGPQGLLAAALAAFLTAGTPAASWSQASSGGSTLGLRGIGSAAVGVAAARVERGAEAVEGQLTIDLGHFGNPRVRLGASAAFLRSFPHSEYVTQDDTTYRDVFYDLSGHVSVTLLARAPTRSVVPWVSFGVGIHALTSSFGSIPIDVRYNTNLFGLRSAAGLRFRGAKRGIAIETGALLAHQVSRATLGLSIETYVGDQRR